MLQLESDKDSLQLQVTVMEDQLDGQTGRLGELEKTLKEKQGECRRMEELVGIERSNRSNFDLKNGELKNEVANLKLKCARLERDINEYRNTTPKLQRPSNLSGLPRSPTPVSSPDDVSPTSKKGVLFSEDDNETIVGGPGPEMETSMVSLSGRS